MLVPAELAAPVLTVLQGAPGVAHLTVMAGAARIPKGDLIEVEVVKEAADELVEQLIATGLGVRGSISITDVDAAVSTTADQAFREAPGSPDSVVWRQVEADLADDAKLSGTFLTFLTIATLLAGIGIVLDSPITIVGAMVVGPEFGPLAAVAVGCVRRRPPLIRRGLIALAVGFPLAMLITAAAAWVASGSGLLDHRALEFNKQTEFIYHVGPFSLIVALLAGAAGMLSTTSQKSAALVGVFISVTTVPAAGYVAVAAVLGEWHQVGGSALQLLINLVGIVVAAVLTLLVVRRVDVRRAARRAHAVRTRPVPTPQVGIPPVGPKPVGTTTETQIPYSS